jgi:hypothetical protein
MVQPECNHHLRFNGMIPRIFLVSISLLLTVSVCLAQSSGKKSDKKTPPDLSGVWTLDYQRSSVDPAIKKKAVDYVLTIVHREPEIRISKTYKQSGREHSEELVYYTDGRAELTSRRGYPIPESVTRWQGDKLVRKTTAGPVGVQTSPPLEVVTIEEWKLSADGKTLTRTITTSGMVMSRVRYVFVRNLQ